MVAEPHALDTFVFAPNLGENTIANSNVHTDAIDAPKSEIADLAAFLTHAHADEAYPIAHDAADITHHVAALTAPHAHHFLV